METVYEHWEEPRAGENLGRVSGTEADRLARAALDAMLTRPFRVGVRPGPEIYDKLLRRVRRSVDRCRPIPITLGYGPMKNPNAVSDSRADWAEFFALNHLIKWHNKVQRVYPPGLAIRIVFDDSTLIMANRADPGQIASYIASIRADRRAGGWPGPAAPDAAIVVRVALPPGGLPPGAMAGRPMGARSRRTGTRWSRWPRPPAATWHCPRGSTRGSRSGSSLRPRIATESTGRRSSSAT